MSKPRRMAVLILACVVAAAAPWWPPARLALPDVPIPYSRPLERFVLPEVGDIVDAARRVVLS